MAFRLAGLAVSLLLLSACAGLAPQREQIRVTVSDIRVIESTLLEQLYEVTLRIQNHGEQAIAITGGSFDLAINGQDLGSGVTDQAVTIPAYSDEKVQVRMVSTVFGMLRVILSLQERSDQTLEYEISGRFSLEGGFGGVSFQEAGEISLPSRTAVEEVQ
jgi:LEA14-like dessication related protein